MRTNLWVLAVVFFNVTMALGQKFNQDLNNIQVTWQLINNFYVDSVNPSHLANETIKSMLEQLDPHSIYLTVDEVKRSNDGLKGDLEGIGVEFIIHKDTVFITSVFEKGPAEIAGIRPGDRILFVNDKSLTTPGIDRKFVVDVLRAKKGTILNLIVERKELDNHIETSVVCNKVQISSIDSHYMLNNKVGYIKISRFSLHTGKEFQDALKGLVRSGMESLILDLRGNSGGYISSALSVLDHFLEKGQLMVYTQGATFPRHNHMASSKGLWQKGGLAVLIDEKTASASEIIAGAIQDWDRGVIIGRRSYGKGLVQRPFSLTDGSEVRLTIAKYYTPSGRSIQKDYSDGVKNYRDELDVRRESGEFVSKDSIHYDTNFKFSTLVNQRTVYGGGGVVPDLFVPIDTADYPFAYFKIVEDGNLDKSALDFLSNNYNTLKKSFHSYKEFNNNFLLDKSYLADLVATVDTYQLKFYEKDELKDFITLYFKSIIAKGLYGNNEYYQVINSSQKIFITTVGILNDQEQIAELLH